MAKKMESRPIQTKGRPMEGIRMPIGQCAKCSTFLEGENVTEHRLYDPEFTILYSLDCPNCGHSTDI